MNPIIISATETNTLSPSRQIIKALEIKWTFGDLGPFSYTTTWEDLQSGKTLTELRKRGASLAALPKA